MVTLLPWPMKIRTSSSVTGGQAMVGKHVAHRHLHVPGTVDQGAVEIVDHGVEAAGDEIVGVRVHAIFLSTSCGTAGPMASRRPMKSPIAAVVLAAGAGTRMKSSLPKVLHPVAGKADGAPCAGQRRAAEARRGSSASSPPGPDRVAAAFAPASDGGSAQAARHRRCGQGRAARTQGPCRAGAGGLCRFAAADDGEPGPAGAGLPRRQGRRRRAGLPGARSVALRPADRERWRAREDRREQGRQSGGEGDRLRAIPA